MARWYAMDSRLEDHPKFMELLDILAWRPCEVVYLLHRLWSYVRERRPDGLLHAEDTERLMVYCRVAHADRDRVTDALNAAGFLDEDGERRVFCVGWMKRNGRWIKDAARLIAYRQRTRTHAERTGTDAVEHGAVSTEQENLEHMAEPAGSTVLMGKVRVRPSEEPDDFRNWYDRVYPRHVKRPFALRAWKAAVKREGPEKIPRLVECTAQWVEYWKDSQTPLDRIPYPASFLNGRQYADTPPETDDADPR